MDSCPPDIMLAVKELMLSENRSFGPSWSRLWDADVMGGLVLSRFSHVRLFATPWTVALQALSYRILQARLLEWVGMPSSSILTQGLNHISSVSCTGRRVLYL